MPLAPTEPKLSSAWDSLRHDARGWPKFLNSVQLEGVRGWTGEIVEFRYPVVAVAGVNGAGKSTVLKAAAAAYRVPKESTGTTFSADDFFPNTPWEEVSGVVLGYQVRQDVTTDSYTVRKKTSRWRGGPERKVRDSYFLDISRIQPANTQIGYGRLAQESISAGVTKRFSSDQVAQLNRTMGRVYSEASFDKDQDKQVGVLEQNGIKYSNFHQGAGEDSVLDLLAMINEAPKHSLVVIDEVEASLHPMAQRNLMAELLRVAEDRRLQIILSTHSSYVLEALPSVARIFVSVDRNREREVLYGVSSEFALNLMDSHRHDEVDIYCEDEEARYVIERLIASGSSSTLKRLKITPVGPANTVISLSSVAMSGKLPRPGVGVVDADQGSGETHLTLPGTLSPERELFSALGEGQWVNVSARIGVNAGELLDAKDLAVQIPNHHAWCKEIANTLGGTIRPSKVWEAIVDVWVDEVVGVETAEAWCGPIVALFP